MRYFLLVLVLLTTPISEARANNWEKFFTSYGPTDGLVPAAGDPEVIAFNGNIDQHMEQMWRKGYVAIGYTYFNSPNNKTSDAKKFAKKLKVSFVVLATDLASTTTTSIPITTPTTTTSQTNGTATVYSGGRSASGTYSGTTTTYGTQTNYIPMTFNRFDKMAMYFMEVPKFGAGIMPRELNTEEVAKYETRKAFVVRWIRDGSPAYNADLLPNDVVLTVNKLPADPQGWQDAIRSGEPLTVSLMRNGSPRELTIVIPDDWRPQSQ